MPTPRLSTRRLSQLCIPPQTRTPTFFRPVLPITDCISPPFESTLQFLKPTCRALRAAWGLISRTVSRRGRGLPEKGRDFAWGKEPGVCGTCWSPHRGKGCGDRRRPGRSPRSKIARTARGIGLLSERFLLACPAGWELTDSQCCA